MARIKHLKSKISNLKFTNEFSPCSSLVTVSSKNNLLYTAKEFDFETGLQFNRYRYYSPLIARFISKEPIFFEKNKYCIHCNNPIMIKDPEGLLPPWWPLVSILIMVSCRGGFEDDLAAGGEGCGEMSATGTACNATKTCITRYTCKGTNTPTQDGTGWICTCQKI